MTVTTASFDPQHCRPSSTATRRKTLYVVAAATRMPSGIDQKELRSWPTKSR